MNDVKRPLRILGAILAIPLFGASAWGSTVDIEIDTTKASEPISPYIYGQFIEHLGRCIYDGLWAEMLEDRKFYYPVDGRAPAWTMHVPGEASWEGEGHPYELLTRSPWMILGDHDAVTMSTQGPFVGEHTPRIALGDAGPGGLQQERLGLVAGKRYTGHVVLAGDSSAAPVDVSLVWGPGTSDRQTLRIDALSADFETIPFEMVAERGTDNGRIEIVAHGTGSFQIGTASLMPADNILGWRTDTLALLKQLDSPVYRWPGGNFVSGYDWRDGIGDRDRRPPRKNPAWKGIESNDVGIHEYMQLCREIDTQPFIAVNTGLGEVDEAALEVEYVNGSVETTLGALRAENGHPQPYGVKFWAVGNEMYGDWQLGHMPLAEYVEKHNRVVDAMRKVDDTVVPIAVGAVGEWSEQMLSSSADHMALISEHLYWQDKDDIGEHVAQVRDGIRRVAEAHRGYREKLPSLKGKDIRIALDEWNYWYGGNEYGELGVRYSLQDALGIAVGLHEYFRNSDLFYMANYAQTVNVIGAIKTTKTQAEMAATGLVLQLYRERFGSVPVQVSVGESSLDVSAAWAEDRTELTLAIVNPDAETHRVRLSLGGAEIASAASRWVITGEDRWAYNRPGAPRGVDIVPGTVELADGGLDIAPLSVTLLSIPVR
jgi:alpha-N-arabinofuranosidase